MVSSIFIAVKRSRGPNTVLVALVRQTSDWHLIQNGGFYRIPVRSAPVMIREGTIEYLAFYFPKPFGDHAYKVEWYGKVNHLRIVSRKEAVPTQPNHPKAETQYYVIGIEKCIQLSEPFESTRPRRLLFIPTTQQKFFYPLIREVNHLFNESPLENLLWDSLVVKKIPAQRQYYLAIKGKKMKLDFAIFCENKSIGIECDGDQWHNQKPNIESDKDRDNHLESHGWASLRFTYDMITKSLPEVMDKITSTINLNGGVKANETDAPRYLPKDKGGQSRLFN
jgi:very-short-patch-repair endonuclease